MALVTYVALLMSVLGPNVVHSYLPCRHNALDYDSSQATPFICDTSATPPEQPLIADFNGDGRDDFFCNKDGQLDDEYYVTSISGVPYYQKDPKTAGWCPSNEGSMVTGDINGDGRADLVCRFSDGNKFQVSYYSGGKFSSPRSLRISLTCPLSSELHIGDVNGDRTEDFVCFDSSSGTVRIHYNGGDHHRYRRHFYDPRLRSHYAHPGYYEMEGSFCSATVQQFRLADLNGDHKKDLFCYDPTTVAGSSPGGQVQIAYSQSHGHYRDVKTVDITLSLNKVWSSTMRLFTVDVNGDRSADLVLIDSGPLQEDVFFFNWRDGQYEPNVATASAVPLAVFANNAAPTALYPGDFNGDGMTDMAIIDTSTPLTIAFSTCDVPP